MQELKQNGTCPLIIHYKWIKIWNALTSYIGGHLSFDDTQPSLQLNAENILIVGGGHLQVGTEEEPYKNSATIMMHGHLRSTELPNFGAKTLAVREGNLELHGEFVWQEVGNDSHCLY